jgi:hypothetical protein
MAKNDPSVIVTVTEEVGENNHAPISESDNQHKMDDYLLSWKPTNLLNEYKLKRCSEHMQNRFFNHITNHVSKANWEHVNIKPSDYLNVEFSRTQQNFLNPTRKDVLLGYITYSVKGDGAVQKIAKRRLDFVDGNVNSYSKVLNNPERLDLIKDRLQLVSTVAQVTAEAQAQIEASKQKKEQEVIKKRQKDREREEKNEKLKQEKLPGVLAMVNKYISKKNELMEETHLQLLMNSDKELKVSMLKDIMFYYYNIKKSDIPNTKILMISLFLEKLQSQIGTDSDHGGGEDGDCCD